MNFKNIDFKSININKYIDLAVLGMAAVSALVGSTNAALLGIIIYLTVLAFSSSDKLANAMLLPDPVSEASKIGQWLVSFFLSANGMFSKVICYPL